MLTNDIGTRRGTSALLWTVQGALSMVFLFTGSLKLILPIAALTQQIPLSGLFIRCLGVFELLCALGVVLPGILRLRPILTILACTGIVVVMIGAVSAMLVTHGGLATLGPVALGLLAACVAYGRVQLLPAEAPIRRIALKLAA